MQKVLVVTKKGGAKRLVSSADPSVAMVDQTATLADLVDDERLVSRAITERMPAGVSVRSEMHGWRPNFRAVLTNT